MRKKYPDNTKNIVVTGSYLINSTANLAHFHSNWQCYIADNSQTTPMILFLFSGYVFLYSFSNGFLLSVLIIQDLFRHWYKYVYSNYFIKNAQTINSLAFMTHNDSVIGGVKRAASWATYFSASSFNSGGRQSAATCQTHWSNFWNVGRYEIGRHKLVIFVSDLISCGSCTGFRKFLFIKNF